MSDHVSLMHACPSCLSGLHLPVFAAEVGGSFAAQQLDVEVVPITKDGDAASDGLRGLASRVNAVARGDVDFALLPVLYLLAVESDSHEGVGARFVAVFHQRNPIAAIVPADSELSEPADLAGRRVGGWDVMVSEYAAALASLGPGAPEIVEGVDGAAAGVAALKHGEVDVTPLWMDMFSYLAGEEFPLRAIPLGVDAYATGLLAGDHVPLEVALRMRDSLAAGLELQRRDPDPGLAAFGRRFPTVSPDHARANWSLFEPYVLATERPLSMDPARWEATVDHTASAHALHVPSWERMFRHDVLSPPLITA